MFRHNRALAVVLIIAGSFLSWISGCSDLQEDCELLVNCPDTADPPICDGIYLGTTCDSCLQSSCCQEVSDCYDDVDCRGGCFFGIMPPLSLCTTGRIGKLFGDLTTCLNTNCQTQCASPDYCNPVTHQGCPTDGTQCEFVYPGIFACYPPASIPAKICEPCNFTTGPYCDSGLRCDVTSLQCARYCCTDADCGTGHCELNQNVAFGYSTANPADLVGLCLAMAPATGPACDAPAVPPSAGTCVAGFVP